MFRPLVTCILLLLLPMSLQAQSAPRSSSKFQWKRTPQNPVVGAVPASLMETGVGAPDVLLKGDTYYLYFYGQSLGGILGGTVMAFTPRLPSYASVTQNIRRVPL